MAAELPSATVPKPRDGAGSDFSIAKYTEYIDEFRRRRVAEPGLTAASFIAEWPEIDPHEQLAVELIYDEFCDRLIAGEDPSEQSVIAAYPRWRSKLEIVLDCHRLLNAETQKTVWPEVGQRVGEFKLLAKLGEGANGRVFLATQPSLSDRNVVLKICESTSEHHSLARLQHTSIVPLLQVDDDKHTGLRLLAMPYLGGCTLEEALESHHGHGRRRASIFLESIRRATQNQERHNSPAPSSLSSPDSPAIRFLQTASYEQAACWIVACLADGLHYAHQRGLVHLDVKPSNVLLAADGQPMLLDFHLAQDISELSSRRVEMLGGTPGYMAPEQQCALADIQNGSTAKLLLDHRCDIFSLGLLLRELLCCQAPPAETTALPRTTPRRLRNIISRCLSSNPNSRFRDASELAFELRQAALTERTSLIGSKWKLLIGFLVGFVVACSVHGLDAESIQGFVQQGSDSAITDLPDRLVAKSASDQLHRLVSRVRDHTAIARVESETELNKLLTFCEQLQRRHTQLLDSELVSKHARTEYTLLNDAAFLDQLIYRVRNRLTDRSALYLTLADE